MTPVIPINRLFHACNNAELEAQIRKCKDKCYAYNQLNPNDKEAQHKILSTLLGRMGKNITIMPSFWCDYGCHIFIGNNFYANHNLIITDGAPVTIGNNVWIGAGSTILAGVSIGDNTVIGAGSVVSKSIPSGVVAVGVPCKVMRKITDEDQRKYPLY